MDSLTPQQRHKVMAAIRSANTRPELIVRKYLWSHGFRYRLNYRRLPGHPDLVLRKYHTCIFVNGCFWHGHEGCAAYRLPKTNTAFWEAKIARNKARDRREMAALATMGWHTIVVWECQLKKDCREQTLASLGFTLNHILLGDIEHRFAVKQAKTYVLPEEAGLEMAAEPFPTPDSLPASSEPQKDMDGSEPAQGREKGNHEI